MEIGIAFIQQISYTVPVENSIRIKTRSIMGTEIPSGGICKSTGDAPRMPFTAQRCLWIGQQAFEKVKELSIRLSMVENAAFRLAANIKKTQKRANALKNITIPHYEAGDQRDIQNALEEKNERNLPD